MLDHISCTRRACTVLTCLWFICSAAAPSIGAQDVGHVHGTVSGGGVPLAGVHVFIEDSDFGSVSDENGRFELEAVPVGTHELTARFVGFQPFVQEIQVAAETLFVEISLEETTAALEEVVVTAIGEKQSRANIAATVQSVGREALEHSMPAHPSEVMNRIPGVWVNATSGEGHMTAIRQPLTTDPVYLFLENGVPVRSTGFFNHNALYEMNVPMAQDVEVMKGPGTALYGSDALAGVVNVSTRRPPDVPTASLSIEGGSFGFGRMMLGTGTDFGRHGLRLDINATKSDGWRDASGYDRQTGTLMWEANLRREWSVRTVASFSSVDQKPAGTASLRRTDFLNRPALNYAAISFRDVKAVRVSSAIEHFSDESVLVVTPYVRYNEMSILPDWSLSYDPTRWTTKNRSFGILTRYRRDLASLEMRVVGGLDLETSPGSHVEHTIQPHREGQVYVDYRTGELIYDYDVSFRQASPYLHAEFAPTDALRLTVGLRGDVLGYDYRNALGVETEGPHRRAASTTTTYRHLSPKLGATYRFGSGSSLFLSYRHAFRVPSEGQLFRQGSTSNTLGLLPVKAENYELGIRWNVVEAVHTEISAYRLSKTDDIITYVDESGVRSSTNAGATTHAGIEGGLRYRPVSGLELTGNLSYAVHRFKDWRPAADLDLSGNEMDVAPRILASTSASYQPPFLPDFRFGLDVDMLGDYWMDPENTTRYDGHTLVRLRAGYDLPFGFTIVTRVNNLTNTPYAERATYHSVRGEEYSPALPRTFFFGLKYRLRVGEDDQ